MILQKKSRGFCHSKFRGFFCEKNLFSIRHTSANLSTIQSERLSQSKKFHAENNDYIWDKSLHIVIELLSWEVRVVDKGL